MSPLLSIRFNCYFHSTGGHSKKANWVFAMRSHDSHVFQIKWCRWVVFLLKYFFFQLFIEDEFRFPVCALNYLYLTIIIILNIRNTNNFFWHNLGSRITEVPLPSKTRLIINYTLFRNCIELNWMMTVSFLPRVRLQSSILPFRMQFHTVYFRLFTENSFFNKHSWLFQVVTEWTHVLFYTYP